jgi:hypothetical protein
LAFPTTLDRFVDGINIIFAKMANQLQNILVGPVWYNVKSADYGAVGDGITDDAAAIQAAINAANTAGGATIYFPPGTYIVKSVITVASSNIKFLGVRGQSIISDSAGGTYANASGIFTIYHQGVSCDRITFEDLSFTINNNNARAIQAATFRYLTINRCSFTGTSIDSTGAQTGMVTADISTFGVNCSDLRVLNSEFVDCTGCNGITLYLRSGANNTLTGVLIDGCHFSNVLYRCVYVNVNTNGPPSLFFDIKVVNCTAIDIIGGAQGGGNPYSALVHAGLGASYTTTGLTVDNNYWRNTRNSERRSFVQVYSTTAVKVTNNTFILTGTAGNSDGMFIAPGRTTFPSIGLEISGNYVDGGNQSVSFWDPDSMSDLDCHHNIVKNCFKNINLGYGTQSRVDIHDNIQYNCGGLVAGQLNGLVAFENITNPHAGIKFHDNMVVDDRTAGNTFVRYMMHLGTAGGFDFSDVEVYDNKLYMPNDNLTASVLNPGGGVVPPRTFRNFAVTVLAGYFHEDGYAETIAVAGAGTVTPDPLFGRQKLITYSGAFTMAAPIAEVRTRGRRLDFKLIHDGTANVYAITWNAVFKRAGGAFANTNTANAVDTISFECDGTNFYEVGRALNLS